MIQKFFITVFIVLPLSLLLKDPEGLGKRIDREIKDEFDISSYQHQGVEISDSMKRQLPARITKENFFQLKNEGKLIGYAYLDKAPSKTAEFDYLVIFDKDLVIARTKVLVYREEYGGEIGSKRWLRQFTGKSKSTELNNIAAISGATISVRSMKRAVKDLLASIEVLQENKVL
jgi:Na+-translocating ferredoxin:NAD+ oxidoreductase RnfG subunit